MTLEEHNPCADVPFTPEHDKAHRVNDKMQKIGEFLEWLSSKGFILGEWITPQGYINPQLFSVNINIQEFLAEFFGIDYKAYLQEKEDAYQYVRRLANESK